MPNNDNGMGELLKVLTAQPELVHALVLDHEKVQKMLRTAPAKQMASGADPREILRQSVAKAGPQGKVFFNCLGGTKPD